MYGRDGRSRGYGTVRYETAEEAQAAIEQFNGARGAPFHHPWHCTPLAGNHAHGADARRLQQGAAAEHARRPRPCPSLQCSAAAAAYLPAVAAVLPACCASCLRGADVWCRPAVPAAGTELEGRTLSVRLDKYA